MKKLVVLKLFQCSNSNQATGTDGSFCLDIICNNLKIIDIKGGFTVLEKVTERIYYLMNEDKGDKPAIGIVKGEKYCLVVDAGNSPEHGNEIISEMEKLNFPPVRYVVATHHHWDHIFGLESYDAIKIASEKTCELSKMYRGICLDDKGLEMAKQKNIFNDNCIGFIKEVFKDRETFKLADFDLLFKGELRIDLGGVTCIIKEIINPHREDGTIIYVPEEKAVFLGDAAYGCSKNGHSYFNREKTISMMNEIDSYGADHFLLSHESICTRDEMDSYWKDLNMGMDMTEGCSTVEQVIANFKNTYNKEPSRNDLFFLESFCE